MSGKRAESELRQLLKDCPIPYGLTWEHVRTGRLYSVIAVCLIESTLEPAVVYKGLFDETAWVRPLIEWKEKFKIHGAV